MKKVYLIAATAAAACLILILVVIGGQRKKNESILAEAERLRQEQIEATVTVVVAASDIPKGTLIQETMLETMEVDRQLLVTLDAETMKENVFGRQAAKDILKGKVIGKSDTAEAGEVRVPLSELIPEGLCAIQIPANLDNAVAEFIEAGDRVNILYAPEVEQIESESSSNSRKESREWETLAEDLEVLRLGDRNWTGEGEYSYVILAVEPQTALRILNMQENSELRMVIRSERVG